MQECYTVTRKLRGLAVIINNMKFDNEESTPARKGSEYDVINMKNLFDGLHFEVREHHNKNAQEILECLKEDKRTLPDSDIFVAVIMSDGSKNCVYGTDGKRVQIEDITTIFNEKNCPKLRETPKIFFIQACQDGNLSHGNQ
ncbi:hypothetical protein CAPTEDRAFT_118277 [Capitella teleta]|uniref:Caspase family p20 domain-containing protein n=1 Tax=Capitella teleta TaxID=283909 RepID=R7UB90_CAPTE|nr:hypothetical protein CAPTEDRAFT_118277 [Capitella teleta]|eukprot:ELU01063.1 hypothetical protein CAPTEDRAFT_118277 [Capitella teleta]